MEAPSAAVAAAPAPAGPSTESLKLFIGQVPRHFSEEDLFPLFLQFGPVRELSVLRDRITGASKGCAFVTFETEDVVDACIAALHDKQKLGEMPNPMQVRPASTARKQDDRKLFVGMTARAMGEEGLRALFEPFGAVEEVVVLRSNDGTSKGCAFVKMDTRAHAQRAIATLHHSRTLEGCRWPLVVKFADSERDKMAKRVQAHMEHFYPFSSAFNAQPFQYPPNLSGGAPYAVMSPPHSLSPHSPQLSPPGPGHMQHGGHGGGRTHLPHHVLPQGGPGSSARHVNPLAYSHAMAPPAYANGHGAQAHLGHAGALGGQLLPPRPAEGPEGSNLFIYHLPQEFNDDSLASTFLPFGNVVSAKVFLDNITHQSKCFGFVSFDNPLSAQRAIETMNGYQIGSKRLKVTLKKPKGARDSGHHGGEMPGGWLGVERVVGGVGGVGVGAH